MKKFMMTVCLFIIASFTVFSCLSLSSCGHDKTISKNYIMMSQGVLSSGKVLQEFDFSLNSSFLEESGLSSLDIQIGKANLIKKIDRFRDEFVMNYALIFGNAENKKPSYALGNDLKISPTEYNEDFDCVSFKITFENQETWKFYNQKQNDGEQSNEEFNNPTFITKQTFSSVFPFGQKMQVSGQSITVAERYRNAYLSAFENFVNFSTIKENYKPDFVYNYATSFNKIKSNSDLNFVDENGMYHHVWIKNIEQINQNSTITLSISTPNRGWWYLTIVGITIVITMLAILIAYLLKKKKLWQ